MMVGRAALPTPFARVPGFSVPALSPRILAQPQLGGDLREENRVETGSARSGPGNGQPSRDRARAREERVRLAGGGAWPRCATLTRWHSDRWREPAAAATARPARDSGLFLCLAHAPRPLPFSSDTVQQSLPGARVPDGPLIPTRPAGLCFRAGDEGGGARTNLGTGGVSTVEDPEEASSQALREPATNWREGGQGRGTLGRMRVGVGGGPQRGTGAAEVRERR